MLHPPKKQSVLPKNVNEEPIGGNGYIKYTEEAVKFGLYNAKFVEQKRKLLLMEEERRLLCPFLTTR
jgi:hypothetical protein